jgi:hypothetical protein
LFMARLAEIAREYELPLRGQELVQSRLRWEDWESLRAETAAFAKKEIRRRKWRGARGGVLPGGGDAEDIADQAIGDLLSGKGRVAIGFVRERLVKELKRLVSGKVRVLHGLREARATRSEWDVLPVKEGDGPVSFFAGLLDGGAIADETAAEREERRERLRAEFARCLDGGTESSIWVPVRRGDEARRDCMPARDGGKGGDERAEAAGPAAGGLCEGETRQGMAKLTAHGVFCKGGRTVACLNWPEPLGGILDLDRGAGTNARIKMWKLNCRSVLAKG